MILDLTTRISTAQELRTSGAHHSHTLQTSASEGYRTSSDAPNGINPDYGKGVAVQLSAQVTADFVSTSADFAITTKIQTSDNANFPTAETDDLMQATVASDQLVAGAFLLPQHVPYGCKRYIRLEYNLSHPATAGHVTTDIVPGIQSNR